MSNHVQTVPPRAALPGGPVPPAVWAGALAAVMALCVAPLTLVSLPVHALLLPVVHGLGLSRVYGQFSAYGAAYVLGYLFLVCLLVTYLRARKRLWGSAAQPTARFADVVCAFSGLYLLDFFISPLPLFDFRYYWWPFLVFAAFYAVLVWCDADRALSLTKLFVLLATVESFHAVVFYIFGVRQFHTPGFGNRTMGTFGNPSVLYALCLISVPLCFALGEVQHGARARTLYRAAATVNLLALLFTYMRAGWLALAVTVLYLLVSRHFPRTRAGRGLAIALLCGLILGAASVRTRGNVIGNAGDRPFWGRVAIWQVTTHVVAQRPWWGHGLNSFSFKQRQFMTAQLKSFNPLNTEAKCLYLNLVTELGVVGLALFGLVAWRYAGLYQAAVRLLPPAGEARAIAIGAHGGVLALAVAGLVDTPILHFYRLPSTLALAVLLGVVCVLVNAARPAQSLVGNAVPGFVAVRRRHEQRVVVAAGLSAAGLLAVLALGGLAAGLRAARERIEPFAGSGPPPKYREYIPLNAVSRPLQDATIAMEDGMFFQHRGIDGDAVLRALHDNLQARRVRRGGSTITQQLAKNLFLNKERTAGRKFREAVLALQMERMLSKERILELYLNTIDYGMGQRGIVAAAGFYFHKTPAQLSLAESALLVGLVPRPPQKQLSPEQLRQGRVKALRRVAFFRQNQYGLVELRKAARMPLDQVIYPYKHATDRAAAPSGRVAGER